MSRPTSRASSPEPDVDAEMFTVEHLARSRHVLASVAPALASAAGVTLRGAAKQLAYAEGLQSRGRREEEDADWSLVGLAVCHQCGSSLQGDTATVRLHGGHSLEQRYGRWRRRRWRGHDRDEVHRIDDTARILHSSSKRKVSSSSSSSSMSRSSLASRVSLATVAALRRSLESSLIGGSASASTADQRGVVARDRRVLRDEQRCAGAVTVRCRACTFLHIRAGLRKEARGRTDAQLDTASQGTSRCTSGARTPLRSQGVPSSSGSGALTPVSGVTPRSASPAPAALSAVSPSSKTSKKKNRKRDDLKNILARAKDASSKSNGPSDTLELSMFLTSGQ